MKKQIIATTLSGLFLKHEPWDKAHILWFNEWARQLKDESILEWIDKPNYFKGVDEVMKRIYPKLSDEERTKIARESYFDSVLEYIKQNPQIRNEEIINYFKTLKTKYQIVLITTNTEQAIGRILKISGLEKLFDIIKTSLLKEKDDKKLVFVRFIKKHGKPIIYIGGSKKDSYDFCKQEKIPCIYANLEEDEEISGVETVHNLKELKDKINFNINIKQQLNL